MIDSGEQLLNLLTPPEIMDIELRAEPRSKSLLIWSHNAFHLEEVFLCPYNPGIKDDSMSVLDAVFRFDCFGKIKLKKTSSVKYSGS